MSFKRWIFLIDIFTCISLGILSLKLLKADSFFSALLDDLLSFGVIALEVAVFAESLRVKETVTMLALGGFFRLAF